MKRMYDVYSNEYGVTITVCVHTDRHVVAVSDLSIVSVCKHGKEVSTVWWESVSEAQLYIHLCYDLNAMFYNLTKG